MPRITRIRLDEKSHEEFTILGLVSAEADYKISQLLNNKLKLSLKNNKYIDIPGVDGSNISFSRYSDFSGSPDISYNLISNRSGENYLLKKLKNIDFIFQIYCNDNQCDIEQLTRTIREIEKITAVFDLDLPGNKEKNLAYLTQ